MGGKALGGRRISRAEAQIIFEKIMGKSPACLSSVLCGSYRRGKPDCGDLDIVVVPENVVEFNSFLTSQFGTRKNGKPANSGLIDGAQVEFYVATKSNLGTFLQMWTGSASHNKSLRYRAKAMGMSMSQYGFKSMKTGQLTEIDSEQKVYSMLNMSYVKPADR